MLLLQDFGLETGVQGSSLGGNVKFTDPQKPGMDGGTGALGEELAHSGWEEVETECRARRQ